MTRTTTGFALTLLGAIRTAVSMATNVFRSAFNVARHQFERTRVSNQELTMTRTTGAWLALALLAATSAAVSMTAGAFRPAITVAATPAEMAAAPVDVAVQPVDDGAPRTTIQPEALLRALINSDSSHAPPGADPPAEPPLAAPVTVAPPARGAWQDRNAGPTPTEAGALLARKPRDSKAEPPGKHSKATANAKGCQTTTGLAELLRKFNLSPRCPT